LKSRITRRFGRAFALLPDFAKRRSREAYRLFLLDPNHPSLQFKQVHTSQPIYSARVGLGYRALAVRQGDELIWLWIGTHADYDQLLRSL
jgi:hypothetical protein